MCVGYKADALLQQIEACYARTVNPLTLTLSFIYFFYLCLFIFLHISSSLHVYVCSVMRRANEEVHDTLVKQRKETKRVKEKVQFSFIWLYFISYLYFLTIVFLFIVVRHAFEG